MIRSLRPHTLLFAAYPILFLYGQNAAELPFQTVVPPLLVSLGAACAAALALGAATRNGIKAGLVVTVWVALFFSYGHLYQALGGGTWIRHRHLLPAWGAIAVALSWGLLRSRRSLVRPDRVLNLVAAVAVAGVGVTLAGSLGAAPRDPVEPPLDAEHTVAAAPHPDAALPDVYYIILDSYAGAPVLETRYGFDNREFLAGLERRGFRVANGSRSNYSTTLTSVASSLNMAHLDELTPLAGSRSTDKRTLRSLIRDNRVERILRRAGYECVEMNSPCVMFQDDFVFMLLRTTAASYWISYGHYAEQTLDLFDRLMRLGPSPKPRFVYAHIVCPHAPYVFRRDGRRVPAGSHNRLLRDPAALRSAYLEQLQFVNTRTDRLVDRILERAKRPVVIVLQADHGPANHGRMDRPTPALLEERMSILNAYRVPESWSADLPDSITPVNTFRVILGRILGTEHVPRPDRSYFSRPSYPYECRPVAAVAPAAGARIAAR